jgi:hypothetical protein
MAGTAGAGPSAVRRDTESETSSSTRPEGVSARWLTSRIRLHLPEDFGVRDWGYSKVTIDPEAGENPVEVDWPPPVRADSARRLSSAGFPSGLMAIGSRPGVSDCGLGYTNLTSEESGFFR